LTFDSTPKGQRRLSVLSFVESLSGDTKPLTELELPSL